MLIEDLGAGSGVRTGHGGGSGVAVDEAMVTATLIRRATALRDPVPFFNLTTTVT